jgi:hypothetical protein
MSYHGERIYRQCLWCDRPFHVWRFQLKQRNCGKFCSHRCYAASRRAFSDALADGRLEAILAPERKRAKAERLSTFSDSAGYSEMEARYAHQYLPPR